MTNRKATEAYGGQAMSLPEPLASHGGRPGRHTLPAPVAVSLFCGRIRQRLTIREAADLIGISHGYLYLLETGQRAPSESVARDLARVLLADRPADAEKLLAAAVPGAGRDWKPAADSCREPGRPSGAR